MIKVKFYSLKINRIIAFSISIWLINRSVKPFAIYFYSIRYSKISTENRKFYSSNLMLNSQNVSVDGKSVNPNDNELKPINSLKSPFKPFEYHTTRDVLIPFNQIDSNYGKFHTALDAMMYIRDHCYRYRIVFKKTNAVKYSKLCQFYDQSKGAYVCMDTLTNTAFNRLFSRVCNLKSTKILKFV